MQNMWRELRSGPKVPDIVYAIVEIPKGSRNKYEYQKANGVIFLDRVLYSSLHYPGDYGKRANDEVFLAVQIETAAGLENVEAIMAVDGVDATLIGPADLALTIGAPIGSEAHDAAIRRVLKACQQHGKIPGMFAATTEIARKWINEGYLFVTVSADLSLIKLGAEAMLHDLDDLL